MRNLLKQVANVKSLLLPFSVSAKDRSLPFTEEMEMAIVFYMTESERKKREGKILKKPPEEIAFIAQSYYPMWLVPWGSRTLLFDGLGVSHHTIFYEVLPDVKTFINDIKGGADKHQAYLAALSDHSQYFQSVKSTKEKNILGLITSSDFIQDFQAYITDAEEAEGSKIEQVCLSQLVDESTISSVLKQLSELKVTLERDIEDLRDAMKLIRTTTRKHVEIIQEENKKIQADLNEKTAAAKSIALEKVQQIQEKYDARILKASQRYERKLREMHLERVKLEKAEERADAQIQRCENEIQILKTRKDAAGERRWKEEKEKAKREVSTLKKNIDALDKRIGEAQSQKKIEISNVRSEFNVQSEAAMESVRELEANRESKNQLSQQEVKSLEDSTSTLLLQLDKLIKQKVGALGGLDKMGIKHRRKTALAYVPLYVSCFQGENQRKYVVFPPSVAGSMGMITKFKGMFGVSKVRSMFQPRSNALTKVLNQMVALIERDPVFKRDFHDTGMQNNILQSKKSRERIQKGLKDLRNEEWISVNEIQTLSSLLKEP